MVAGRRVPTTLFTVELDVAPPLPEAERQAVRNALVRAGIQLDGTPDAYGNAWRRAAAREAVESEPAPGRYARSPRSTRGATRA